MSCGCLVRRRSWCLFFFFFQAEDGIRDVAVTGVQTCALPICFLFRRCAFPPKIAPWDPAARVHALPVLDRQREEVLRSEEHTSELQSRLHLVCRLLLEKKKKNKIQTL